MKKLIAPALLAMVAMTSHALAQSATDTSSGNRTERSSSGADTSGANSDRSSGTSSASGQASRAGQSSTVAGQSSRTQSTTQARPGSSSVASQGGQQGSQGDMLSQHIAVCLALGNQEEVALGQFAKDRAQNPEVKQFAQMMVQEHQQAISQLQQASPQLASMNLNLSAQGGATPGASNSNRGAGSATTSSTPTTGSITSTSANQRNTATAGGGADGQTQQHVQFAQEVKQQCLQLTTAELGRKQGAEFDKAYIGQQLVAHTQMLATLQAAQRHASSELQPIIQQGTQMTEHHLAQARQIMEQLSASGAAGGQAPRQSAAQTPPRS